MQVAGWVLLSCVLGGLGAAHAGTPVGAEDATTLAATRALSAPIYAATREIEAVHAGRASASRDLDLRIGALRREVDALRRRAGESDAAGGTSAARKVRQVSLLVANLERAARIPATTTLPALLPQHLAANRQIPLASITPASGGTCATALGFGAGAERTGFLRAREEFWLRIERSNGPALVVHTKASPLDTEIAAFETCPTSGADAPARVNDDNFGLAASVLVDLRDPKGPRWLRVRNLGEAGEVSIIAEMPGSIRGRVTDAADGNGIPAYLDLFDGLGFNMGHGYASDDGRYEIPIDAGNYYVTAMLDPYLAQAWPNAECLRGYDFGTCTPGQAQLVPVTDGHTTSDIDFALGAGARITGHVRDIGGGAITNAQLALANAQGVAVSYNGTDAVGRYSFAGLPQGTYYVEATTYSHRAQVYSHADCPPPQPQYYCDPTLAGTPIVLNRDGAFGGADFDMNPLLYIHVAANFGEGGPPQFATSIAVYDASVNLIALGNAYPGEIADVGPLPAGSYYVVASAAGYFPQLYDHVECATDCFAEFPLGTPVTVADGLPVPSVVFDMAPQATVSGRITDATTGGGLTDVVVQLWPTGSTFTKSTALTLSDGSYSIPGIPPGSYWVVARSSDHHDMAYVNALCDDNSIYTVSGCQLTQAQVVTVGHGGAVPGIDLALPLNASVSGSVRYRGPGDSVSPVSGVNVWLYNESGSPARVTYTLTDGTYRIPDTEPGTYFIETYGGGYFGQIYAGIDCPAVGQSCDATVGTPLVLAQGAETGGVDFDVVGSRRMVGRVTDAVSGNGIANVIVDSWNGQTDEHCAASATDSAGYYAINDDYYTCYYSTATRKVSTDAGIGYVDQVYAGIVCPYGSVFSGLCSLDEATIVTYPDSQPVVTEVNFVLGPRISIFANGFD
jgi:hypothetical protein